MRDVHDSRWQRLDEMLDAALELDPPAQAAFLDQACAGDPQLRADAEALLADAGAATFLDTPAAAFAAPLLPTRGGTEGGRPGGNDAGGSGGSATPHAPADGAIVGPYRVVRELGRGGMGAVYLAERADGQFEQQVALKLIKRGMDSEEIHRRFLAERQILARLSHPNIARLLDGGVSADGRPYFAMEYVEGSPITAHCDERRLTIDERLRLFRGVCSAVGYAHQSLVVHRDLKPSNILVTPDGTVKLLDFGVAKLLRREPGQEAGVTRTGVRVMTPEYAAPEQVLGARVTTATDVYALGAVLYELLTGRRAHRFRKHTPAEVARVVCEVAPELPSTAVTRERPSGEAEGDRPASAADDAGHARGLRPDALRRRLRGDLDTIVLKALHKDPMRRYSSADALLEDLRRHAAGLPVLARPDSVRYRAGKFVRRHRLGAAAGAAVLMALVGGLAGTAWQARKAAREAAKANAVTSFLVSLFKVSDPAESRGREITARELLARGTRRVDSALVGQPAVKAELLHVLADIHSDLGLYDQADTLARRALAISQELSGPQSLDVADELNTLGSILWNRSAYAEAETVLTRALVIRRQRLGSSDTAVATTLVNLAAVAGGSGDSRRQQALLREAIAIDRRRLGDGDPGVAQDLSNLGVSLQETGDYTGADSALRAAIAIYRRRRPADDPSLLIAMHNLAGVRNDIGDLAEAERLEREVLAGRRRIYPNGHPDLAYAAHQLANLLTTQGRYAESESLLVEALTIRRKWLGADHHMTLATVNNLGVLKYLTGELRQAEGYAREAFTGWERTIGAEHPHTITALGVLGSILSKEGKHAEAGRALETVLTRSRKISGDSALQMANALGALGSHYRLVRRHDKAERLLREALAIDRARLPAGHVTTAVVLTTLGGLLTERGRAAEAEPLLREALAIRVEKHGDADQRTANTQRELGMCLAQLGRHGEAERLLLASERSLRATPTNFRYAEALQSLVNYYESRGRRTDAAKFQALLEPAAGRSRR